MERLRIVPVPRTAWRFTTVPSYTPQFPPTSTSSSTITGSAPAGSRTPPICAPAEMCCHISANLRPRRNVAALPHLRATANERVRINHRAFAHIRPHVHEHRRHANHAAANVGSVANARAPRNDAHFIGSRESPNRISGFVEERLFGGVNGHVRDGTHAKAKKDSLLHPGVDAPTGFRRGVGLRRANFAAVQCRLEITEQPVMFLFVVLRRLVEKSFNERWLHAISRGQAPRSRVGPAPATPVPRGCARDFPLLAAPGAGATPARATPFPPAPLSPEWDSIRRS